MCVGATNRNYEKWANSAFGKPVGIWAPGEDVLIRWAPNWADKRNGTSYATPAVSGTMAIFLGYEASDINRNAKAVYARLQSNLLPGIVDKIPQNPSDSRGPNNFLNTGINRPSKRSIDPYEGIPRDGLATAAMCKLDVTEIWTCEPQESNLYARMTITGSDNKVLYETKSGTSAPGVPINDAHPLRLKEPGMSQELVVTGEHQKDYIQFTYGTVKWVSGQQVGDAHCTLNGPDWNPKGPPNCPSGVSIVSCPFSWL